MRRLIADHLWDDHNKVFANRFLPPPNGGNGSFTERIAPTSFFALAARAASNEQAAALIKHWLFNPDKFCIAPDGVPDGTNSAACYYGLPSIAADDPSFAGLGYWRGYVWAPWAQLTYWSLQEYAEEVEGAALGKRALAKQMVALMMSQWEEKGHVCENFFPFAGAGECSGDPFYHWGALAGFLGVQEAVGAGVRREDRRVQEEARGRREDHRVQETRGAIGVWDHSRGFATEILM